MEHISITPPTPSTSTTTTTSTSTTTTTINAVNAVNMPSLISVWMITDRHRDGALCISTQTPNDSVGYPHDSRWWCVPDHPDRNQTAETGYWAPPQNGMWRWVALEGATEFWASAELWCCENGEETYEEWHARGAARVHNAVRYARGAARAMPCREDVLEAGERLVLAAARRDLAEAQLRLYEALSSRREDGWAAMSEALSSAAAHYGACRDDAATMISRAAEALACAADAEAAALAHANAFRGAASISTEIEAAIVAAREAVRATIEAEQEWRATRATLAEAMSGRARNRADLEQVYSVGMGEVGAG